MADYSTAFDIALYLATWLVTTVFGIVLIFAIVVMPGIAKLDDGNFLRAFQVIDGVIQKNQPVFMVVWVGSIIATIVSLTFAYLVYFAPPEDSTTMSTEKVVFVTGATVMYLMTQLITFTKNVPLNNRIQTLDIFNMDLSANKEERDRFEDTWNFWNNLRTVIMGTASLCLLYIALGSFGSSLAL